MDGAIIFFRKHMEQFLVGLAVLLIGIMASCFVWGVIYLSQNLDSVFSSKSAEIKIVSFDLSDAKNLNLRGLLPQ
jgi:predicted thioredoxin/glutaredoxin